MILSGRPFDYLIVFLGGILISFTPCVYPLIPITAGFIGVRAEGSKLKGFTLSLSYVTGVALTYSLLGVIASLTGSIFGRISTSPITYFIVGIIIILFGLSMAGLFIVPLPSLIKLPAVRKGNHFSAFALGMASGLVVSPCLSPALFAILAYLVTRKNILYGATLLFTFAYGMGLVLILVGTFSAAVLGLFKSGRWMEYIKKACALIIIALGVYFLYQGLKGVTLSCAHAEELAVDFTLEDLQGNKISLTSYKDKQPVVLFFWTTWCPFCRQELKSLSQRYPELVKEGWELLAINVGEPAQKVDNFIKNYGGLSFKVLLDKNMDVADAYNLLGVPTYILINKKGDIVFHDPSFPKEKYKELK